MNVELQIREGTGSPILNSTFNIHNSTFAVSPPHFLPHPVVVLPLVVVYRAGAPVAARLPSLSTYLGHVAPANTYWYLQAAPELLTEAAHRLEAHPAEGGDRR